MQPIAGYLLLLPILIIFPSLVIIFYTWVQHNIDGKSSSTFLKNKYMNRKVSGELLVSGEGEIDINNEILQFRGVRCHPESHIFVSFSPKEGCHDLPSRCGKTTPSCDHPIDDDELTWVLHNNTLDGRSLTFLRIKYKTSDLREIQWMIINP